MARYAIVWVTLIAVVMLAACQQPFNVVPTNSPVPSDTPEPAFTPTPVPTDTPVPTPTPLPVPATPMTGSYFGSSLNMDALDPPGQVDAFTAEVGKAPSIVLTFQLFTQPVSPTVYLDIASRGAIPMLTLEPRYVRTGPDARNGVPLIDIVKGVHDQEFRQRAREIRDLHMPIFLRFGHEMNGDWFSWSGVRNGGATTNGYGDPTKPDGPEVFVDAWRHLHDIFAAEGADNVSWVFCANVRQNLSPDLMQPWNHWKNYYPGDGYVDWLAIDGYNWGTSQPWGGKWQSFTEIFQSDYQEMTRLADKPIMIAEFSTTSTGGDKAAWILDAYKQIKTKLPRVKAVVWLDQTGETDWQFDTTTGTLWAFQQAVSDPYFVPGRPIVGQHQ